MSELSEAAGHPAGVAELLGVGKNQTSGVRVLGVGSLVEIKEKHLRRSIGLLSPTLSEFQFLHQ